MRSSWNVVLLSLLTLSAYAADVEPTPATTADTQVSSPDSDKPSPAADGSDATAPTAAVTTVPADFMSVAAQQLEAKEFSDAERTLTTGLEALEQTLPRYDIGLAKPLTMLGDAQSGTGDYAAAEETYGRAIHVTRVNEGLHTPAQVPIIYKEADALAALGEYDEANSRQEIAYETLRRAYGPTNEALVPGMYALAAWYKRTHNIFAARELYDAAVAILERVHGTDSTELVLPLRGVAETYRQERFPPYLAPTKNETFSIGTYDPRVAPTVQTQLQVNRYGDGERALARIVRILHADPDAPRLDYVLALLDLADWHLLFEKYSRAFELYDRVQALMVADAGLTNDELVPYFGQPVPLYFAMPGNPEAPPAALRNRATEGYVDLGYTVDDRGRIEDLKTLASDPAGMMDLKVRRAMRNARFRPRFEDGKPVATAALKYRHRFLYYPRPEPGAEQTPNADPQPPASGAKPAQNGAEPEAAGSEDSGSPAA